MIGREIEGEKVPLPYLVRGIKKKSIASIVKKSWVVNDQIRIREILYYLPEENVGLFVSYDWGGTGLVREMNCYTNRRNSGFLE